jgi:hypothetical protein
MPFKTTIIKLILLLLLNTIYLLAFGQNKRIKPFQKNDFRLDLKLPWINHLTLNPDNKFKENRFGFVGVGVGIEYNYAKNKYLETSFSAAATSDIPFPAPVLKNYNKNLTTFYACVTDNIIKNRFTVGYGINYADNRWAEVIRDFSNNGLSTTSQTEYSNKSIGLTLNTYYRLGKTANLGMTYRPSLFNIENNFRFLYEHLITVEFMWRFSLL